MKFKLIASALLLAGMAGPATAELASGVEKQKGEALAWTIAAYASCDSVSTLQRDIRAEGANAQATPDEIVGALKILSESDQVCGLLNTYAADMVILSTLDFELFQARLVVNEDPPAPYFEQLQPEGAGRIQTSVILDAANAPPPQSSAGTPTSDYQN